MRVNRIILGIYHTLLLRLGQTIHIVQVHSAAKKILFRNQAYIINVHVDCSK